MEARLLKIGETITVPELAKRMGVKTEELVTTLVAGGFFSTTRKSVLTRANAASAAWMFGWSVEPAAALRLPLASSARSSAGPALSDADSA